MLGMCASAWPLAFFLKKNSDGTLVDGKRIQTEYGSYQQANIRPGSIFFIQIE